MKYVLSCKHPQGVYSPAHKTYISCIVQVDDLMYDGKFSCETAFNSDADYIIGTVIFSQNTLIVCSNSDSIQYLVKNLKDRGFIDIVLQEGL